MSVLKRRSNNIKDGQYVIAFSDSRALIDISKDCGMTWTRRQPSDLPNVNEYFFSNDRTRIAMSGDGRHIYCSCYMANVGLLRSTDFLETAEPFKPDNCYSVYSIACNGRGNLVAVVCQNSNNKYDLMLSGDYGEDMAGLQWIKRQYRASHGGGNVPFRQIRSGICVKFSLLYYP